MAGWTVIAGWKGVAAGAAESLARTISRVLYPDDSTEAGKELRDDELNFMDVSKRVVIVTDERVMRRG